MIVGNLEIDLEVHTAPSNVILRQKETFAELRGSLERSQAEVSKLSVTLEAARAELAALRQQSLGESERSSAMLETG